MKGRGYTSESFGFGEETLQTSETTDIFTYIDEPDLYIPEDNGEDSE